MFNKCLNTFKYYTGKQCIYSAHHLFCNCLIFNSTSRIENQMYSHFYPLPPAVLRLLRVIHI